MNWLLDTGSKFGALLENSATLLESLDDAAAEQLGQKKEKEIENCMLIV